MYQSKRYTRKKEEFRKKNKYIASFFIFSLSNLKKEIKKFKKLTPEERKEIELTKGLIALSWIGELCNAKGKTQKEVRSNRNKINEKYLSKIKKLKYLKR